MTVSDLFTDFWDFADQFVRVMCLLIVAPFVVPVVLLYFWWNRHATAPRLEP